jgi:putative ABC transport system ATP-binding protein
MAVATAEPIVRCCETTKEFLQGKSIVRALRGVTLDVYPGQLTLLVGPSGCGKTTLLSVIAGILDPTAGTALVMGKELSQLSTRRKALFRRARIGFVFQQFNLLPALTAVENVAVPLIIAGCLRGWAVERAAKALTAVGLDERLHALPAQLSGGEQQRVAIARALVHQPELIVCDEPTSALDARIGQTIMGLLRDVAVRPDRAVIVVTHDPRVFSFADRIASMEDGRVTRIELNGERTT